MRSSKKRKSIVTEYEQISVFSGREAECKHHLIFGVSGRSYADDDGLFIPLTNDEHNLSMNGTIYQIHGNPAAEKLSKMLGQACWERHHIAETGCTEQEARSHFMVRYGKSYM